MAHTHNTIGFDAKRANANNTGLGNYSRFVIDAVAQFYPNFELLLYVPKKKDNKAYEVLLKYPQLTEKQPLSSAWSAMKSLWRTFGVAAQSKKDGVDIYHGLSNELPVGLAKRGVKSIVTIHDLIFLRYPEFYKPIDRAIYKWKFRYACRVADRIIAVSECTKRDIVHFFGIHPDKIEVIYQGCEPIFEAPIAQQTMDRVKHTYQLPDRFILNVGSIETRKNLLLVVQALRELPEEFHLVAVGRRTKYTEEIEAYAAAHGLTHRIHLLHRVSYLDLPAIYRMAEVFAYPSRYEGFGIPIIEAISAGLPVVATTGSCLEEAGGGACIYVSPDDASALARAILHFVSMVPAERAQRTSLSSEYIRRFNKQEIAARIAALYEKVLSK